MWLMFSSLLMLPVGLIRWKNTDNNRLYAKFYGPIARWLMGIKVIYHGLETLSQNQPCIYSANHQSGFDVAVYAGFCPRKTVLIGKKEMRLIPFWGLMFESFGNIMIDRKNRSQSVGGLNQAVDALKRMGLSIFIFPEGTRNRFGTGLLPFKKGAFHMAVAAQVPIVPIVCSPIAPLINFEKKYARSGTLHLAVLPAIPTVGRTPAQLEAVMAETRQAMLKKLEELSQARY